MANVFRFAAYKQNILECASRAAYKFNCHIRLCPARVVVVATAGCGVSRRVASRPIPRVVVAAMVTRLQQLILKIKSFLGGCFNPQRGGAERGVIWPRLGRPACRWQYPAPLAECGCHFRWWRGVLMHISDTCAICFFDLQTWHVEWEWDERFEL